MSRLKSMKRWGVILSSLAVCSSASSPSRPVRRGGVIGLPVQARRWNVAPRRDGGRWHAGPQVNYTLQYWQLYQATYDGLVSFQKVGGDPSFDVVPDLATACPR